MAKKRPKSLKSPGLPRGFSFDGGSPDGALFIRPMGIVHGAAARAALRDDAGLALNGAAAYLRAEILCFGPDGPIGLEMPAAEIGRWAEAAGEAVMQTVAESLRLLAAPVPGFAGLDLAEPCIMAIVNATPDSFSDGIDRSDPARAIGYGLALIESGPDIVDIGGESTRPGAAEIPIDVERRRVLPVIEALAGQGVPLSVDTRHAPLMREAIAAGAKIINDISALTHDREAMGVAAESGAPLVLMHHHRLKSSDHAPGEVVRYLHGRIRACEEAGIPRERIAVDPGVGFGKSPDQNVRVLAQIALLHGLGCPIVQGTSHKLGRDAPPTDRIGASVAATAFGVSQGVQIHRVHEVAENRQALRLIGAIQTG